MDFKIVREGESLFKTLSASGNVAMLSNSIRIVRLCTDSTLTVFHPTAYNSDGSIMLHWRELNAMVNERKVVLIRLRNDLLICLKIQEMQLEVINYVFNGQDGPTLHNGNLKSKHELVSYIIALFNAIVNNVYEPKATMTPPRPNPPPSTSPQHDSDDEKEFYIEETRDPFTFDLSGLKYAFIIGVFVAVCSTPMQHVSFDIEITYEGCGLMLALAMYHALHINIVKDDQSWADMKPSRMAAGVFIYLVFLFFIRLALEMAGYNTNVWFGIQFIVVQSVIEYVGLIQGGLGFVREVTSNHIVTM